MFYHVNTAVSTSFYLAQCSLTCEIGENTKKGYVYVSMYAKIPYIYSIVALRFYSATTSPETSMGELKHN